MIWRVSETRGLAVKFAFLRLWFEFVTSRLVLTYIDAFTFPAAASSSTLQVICNSDDNCLSQTFNIFLTTSHLEVSSRKPLLEWREFASYDYIFHLGTYVLFLCKHTSEEMIQ